MASRPDITYNARGEVVMHVENSITVHMRFSPDVAREIGRKFLLMADGADKIRAENKYTPHEKESAPPEAFGQDAWSEKDGLT